MTDLQRLLEETISSIVHLEKVSIQLGSTQGELAEVEKEIVRIESRLNRELRDIERLEGLSTKGLFYKILGSQKEQLEKERQEFLDLNLRYKDAQSREKILEYEINLLEAKLRNRNTLEAKLKELKQRREQEIMDTDPHLRSVLMDISENLEAQYRLKKELQEAIDAGTLCHQLTVQVITHLQKVRNWGKWGGHQNRKHQFRIKRDAVDRARNIAFQVKHHLDRFDKELQDLGRRLTFTLDYAVLDNFTNFFFDNLITDWILQQKVTKALSSVKLTKSQLETALAQLNKEYAQASASINQLHAHRDKVIST